MEGTRSNGTGSLQRVGLPPPRRSWGPNQSPRADEARMRTNSRRGAHALTMVVLTAAVSLSGRVEAQQTGLFPLAPIRRQRVPCDREDPTYKIYKQQYFGYHPTCWRHVPAGLGMPESRGSGLREIQARIPARPRHRGNRGRGRPVRGSADPTAGTSGPRRCPPFPTDRVDPFGEMEQPQRACAERESAASRQPRAPNTCGTAGERSVRRRPQSGIDHTAVAEPLAGTECPGGAGRGCSGTVGAGRTARRRLRVPLRTERRRGR